MERKYFYIIPAVIILALIGINAYFFLKYPNLSMMIGDGNKLSGQTTTTSTVQQRIIETKCNNNSDCMWEITNCCSENAGGKWECINGKTFVAGCPENILCPQYVSPKPTNLCSCNQGSCSSQ